MDEITKIEVSIDIVFDSINILIIPSILKAYKDNKEYNITEDFLQRFLRIICLWDHQYIDDSVIDPQTYNIKIYSENIDTYYGKGKFPDNYRELLDLLGDLDG